MKKSLFISTVMMVVLLVAALSTATFAWYTSSNTVTVSEATVNSAAASGANIAIGWVDNAPIGANNIEFKVNETAINPMVPTLGGAILAKADTYLTATLSNGELANPTGAAVYQAVSATDAQNFYVINYSARATNIVFSSTVTGENAARLRIAIFRGDGVCVYTNAGFYTGAIDAAIPRAYSDAIASDAAPAGWADDYSNNNPDNGTTAFSTTNTDVSAPTAVAGTAPLFQQNRFWASAQVGQASPQALMVEPVDWLTNYAIYSSTSDVFTAVTAVAPSFAHYVLGDGAAVGNEAYNRAPYLTAHTVYTLSAAQPEKLNVSATAGPAIQVATNLAQCTDGITGISQSYTVRAWFDGPTQVDAFGGKAATFAITATSNPV